MNKTEIISAAENIFKQFSEACISMEEPVLFKRPENKWSGAENIQHLIISTNTTTLAYALPRFLVRWIGGTPNRISRTFEDVKAKYYKKLSEGGRASGRFVPKPIEIKYGKQKLLDNWSKATAKFIKALEKNRSEKDLDNYLVKHPLLGRITLRELCYFTIFHTEHHLHSIQKPVETS
ncbi:MAG: DinB family protein [Ferruginibacter sp.]